LPSTMHSLRLAEINVKAAVFTALETADICVTISSQLRPSSSIRATEPSWPCARLILFAIASICSSSERTCAIFLVAMISTYSDLLQIRQPAPLRCAAHILTKWFSCIHCRLLVNTWFISLVVVPKENLPYPRGYMSKAGYFDRCQCDPSHNHPGQHSHSHWTWADSADRLPPDS